jgi:ubiquinone/menaquinone biosynthesis C-methylase UbiE
VFYAANVKRNVMKKRLKLQNRMSRTKTHTYSAKKADRLNSKIRRLLQNPDKILSKYVQTGMNVLDYGCGVGYFTIPISKMVGSIGKVYAVDIQQEMLEKLGVKLSKTDIKNVVPVLKGTHKLNIAEKIDLAIAIYVVHEVRNQKEFFLEINSILNPHGKLIVIEPNIIVQKKHFNKTIEYAVQSGFAELNTLNSFMSKSRVFQKK